VLSSGSRNVRAAGSTGRYGRRVTSNLACVGLAVADRDALHQLIDSALRASELIGRRGACELYRWQDPSGARLVVAAERRTVVGFLPSFAGRTGARLAEVRVVNEDVVVADVIDETGEPATRLAAEIEQLHILPARPVEGPASIVALGVDVTIHATAQAFAASDASMLHDADDTREPPAHFVDNGWPWPPRMAAESFISYGVFDGGQPYARLNGLVLGADVRTVTATGQRFVAARVRSAGFKADVCLPADDSTVAPMPGSVIAGTVFLVVSMPDLPSPPQAGAKRSWLPWKR
jgi:hypothetical protein